MGKYGFTEFVFLRGKVKWCRPDKVNEWGKWSTVLYPDAESLEKVRELQAQGIKNVVRKDEDGYNVSFSRPMSREIKGKVIGMTPVDVFEADGKTPLRQANIGNGSDVIIKLEVYGHATPGGGKAKAARWLSMAVLDLVPYAPEDQGEKLENEVRAAKGLDKEAAKEPLF
jgi:hypothetical protein